MQTKMLNLLVKPSQKGYFPQLYGFDWLHENKYESVYINHMSLTSYN